LKTLQPTVNNKIIATCFPISLHTQLKLQYFKFCPILGT